MLVVRVVFLKGALLSELEALLSVCLHPYLAKPVRRALEAVQGQYMQHLPEFG